MVKVDKKLRRRLKEQPITMTRKEIDKMKKEATQHAIEFMMLFPTWILRSKYGFGEKRIREFIAFYQDLIDSYNKGYVSLEDIALQLEKEVNIKAEEVGKDG